MYCKDCGKMLSSIQERAKKQCDICASIIDRWTHNRFKHGDKVITEYGIGRVVSIDLPLSKTWRWLVEIIEPSKQHFLIESGKPLAFFDNEIRHLTNAST
jgi:hypothetical protein